MRLLTLVLAPLLVVAACHRGAGPPADRPVARGVGPCVPGLGAAEFAAGDLGDSTPEVRPALILNGVFPQYPVALRGTGRGVRVVAAFTVDTAGRVEPRTVLIAESNDARYAAEVCGALPRMAFTPARRHGRPVRARVAEPFEVRFTRTERRVRAPAP